MLKTALFFLLLFQFMHLLGFRQLLDLAFHSSFLFVLLLL